MLPKSVDRMHLTVSGIIQARADVVYSNTVDIFLEVCLQPVQCLLFLSSCLPCFRKKTAKPLLRSASYLWKLTFIHISGVPRGGLNPPEIPKALQNRAKLNPIVKTVKNCWI